MVGTILLGVVYKKSDYLEMNNLYGDWFDMHLISCAITCGNIRRRMVKIWNMLKSAFLVE